VKAGVLTISDGVSAGEREDESGALLVELLEGEQYEVEHRVVPDERPQIAAALRALSTNASVILTTGGTGVSPRDFTPEATESVIERNVPGIAEALRADAIRKTPHGLLGRGLAGVRLGNHHPVEAAQIARNIADERVVRVEVGRVEDARHRIHAGAHGNVVGDLADLVSVARRQV